MSIPVYFNRQLRRQQLYFAAWPAIINGLAVGDYGLMRRGIFIKSGNVRDQFGVDFSTNPTPASSFSFSSEGTSKVRFQAGAEVPVFEAVDVDARLEIAFGGSQSMSVSAAKMSAVEMASTHEVARALVDKDDWNPRYRVISKVYTAEGPSIFVSIERNTKVVLKGKAKFLKQIDDGLITADADIGVEVSSNKVWTLPKPNEETFVKGPLGISLFRVRRNGMGIPMLGGSDGDGDDIDGSEEWASDADDSDLVGLIQDIPS